MANTSGYDRSPSKEMVDAIKNAFTRQDLGQEGVYSECRFCGNRLKVDKVGNLKRHLQTLHQREYTEMLAVNSSTTGAPQMRIIPAIPVPIDKNFLTECCVKMVTVGGLSFRSLEQPGLADLVNLLGSAVNSTINRRNILDHLTCTVEAFRKRISDEMRGQIICLKLDAATRRGRSVLAVCSQFLRNGKFVMRTLAVYDLNVSHTAEVIKSEVIRVVAQFGVDIGQIYVVTTDNGANFLKATQLLHEAQRNASGIMIDYDIDLDGETSSSEETDQQDASHYLEANPDEDNTLNVITNAIVGSFRCSAHSLQLCVYKVIKLLNLKEGLSRVRTLAKQLRTKR